MLILALTAVLAAELNSCAERAVAAAPPSQRVELTRWLHGPDPAARLDEREKEAMGQHDELYARTLLLGVAEEAGRAGDRERAARAAAQMEANARATHVSYEMEILRREAQLARANAAAGKDEAARTHLAAARALLPKISDVVISSAHHELLLAALAVHDEALAQAEEQAFLAVARGRDVLDAARALAYVGEGRRALRYADRPGAGSDQDRLLGAILEGVKSRKDLPLALDIVARITTPRERIMHVQQLWIGLDPAQRQSAPFLAAVRELLAIEQGGGDVDDLARVELVQVLADVGLTKEALAVTTRVVSPWTRARTEANVAEELALVNRAAAARLAHQALTHAARPGFRTSVDNDRVDIDTARASAAGALARAGAVGEARRAAKPWVIDVAIGLHDKPAALAAWWKTLDAADRARVVIAALHEGPGLGDGAFLVPLCK